MTAVVRLRQGMRALFALVFAPQVDHAPLKRYLTPTQIALFSKFQRSEQLHSIRVLKAVMAQEYDTPHALKVAALLHDIGKTCHPVGLFGKTLPVLVKAFAPALLQRWSAGSPENRWQRPFVVYAHHPVWSGHLIAYTGGGDDATWLATHHADDPQHWRDHPLYGLLVRLQAADNNN
jgi:hypothetical protein